MINWSLRWIGVLTIDVASKDMKINNNELAKALDNITINVDGTLLSDTKAEHSSMGGTIKGAKGGKKYNGKI